MTDFSLERTHRERSSSPGHIPPSDHIVHIYENDETLLDTLEQFIVGGLRSGESVIAIATAEHLAEINERLSAYSVDGSHLRRHYICFEAEEALSKFLVNGCPDEELFMQFVNELLDHARFGGRACGCLVKWSRSFGRKGTKAQPSSWNDFGINCVTLARSHCFAPILKKAFPKIFSTRIRFARLTQKLSSVNLAAASFVRQLLRRLTHPKVDQPPSFH